MGFHLIGQAACFAVGQPTVRVCTVPNGRGTQGVNSGRWPWREKRCAWFRAPCRDFEATCTAFSSTKQVAGMLKTRAGSLAGSAINYFLPNHQDQESSNKRQSHLHGMQKVCNDRRYACLSCLISLGAYFHR